MLLTQLISLVGTTDACDKSGDFFGLVPWYHYIPDSSYLNGTKSSCEITNFNVLGGNGHPSDIALVMLAIIDDLLRVAALIAIGFIIYGAFQYVASQGNPEHTAKAQSTVINALVGLTIAIVAVAFVSFLGSQFGS